MKYLIQDKHGNLRVEHHSKRPSNALTSLFEGQECSDITLLDIIDRQDTHMVTKIQRDEQDKPLLESFQEPVLDLEGKPVLDEESKPVLRDNERTIPVLDKDGNEVLEERPLGAPYKVAVFNQEKYNQKQAELLATKAAEDVKRAADNNRREQLKAALPNIKSMTASEKWILFEKLMQEVLG